MLNFCAVSILYMFSCFHVFGYVWVTESPTIGRIAVHSASYMFSEYKYLIFYLVFALTDFGVVIYFS